MSRDWTPREHLAVEQMSIAEGRGTYFDFLRNSHWVIDGEKIPLRTEEEIALRETYPLFGKLFDRFEDLHASLSGIEGGLDLLRSHEKDLQSYIEQGRGDRESYLIRWFNGELDEGFYYREHNDELFLENILEEAKSFTQSRLASRPPLQDQIKAAEDKAVQQPPVQPKEPTPDR